MESLAAVVGLIFLTALFSGPIAFGLSFIRTSRPGTRIIKRIFVSLLCIMASMSGAFLMISNVVMPVRILGLVGLSLASIAIFRTFQPEPKWKSIED